MAVANPKVVYVSNQSELLAAFNNRTAETTIYLKPGAYGTITLDSKYTTNLPLTIKSTVPDGASFEGLTVKGLTGLSIEGIKFQPQKLAGDATADSGLDLRSCTNIKVNDCSFVGDSSGHGRGLTVLGSTGVSVTNSNFDGLYRGAIIGELKNIVVDGNVFKHNVSDGIDFAQVQNVEVSHNVMSDFTPGAGSHPDFIQFLTAGTTAPSSNIYIHDNTLLSPAGRGAQGIFFGNEINLTYKNVVIENNTIVTDMLRGISVKGADGLTIKGNTVTSPDPSAQKAFIALGDINLGTVSGNKSDGFLLDTNSKGMTIAGNDFVPDGTGANDKIVGSAYADDITGGKGNDKLAGNAGNDFLYGGNGADRLTGGTGADTFYFKGTDLKGAELDMVQDLNFVAKDKIVLDNFVAGTFKDASGGNALQILAGGKGVVLDSIKDVAELASQSDAVVAKRFSTDGLLLTIHDAAGDTQKLLLLNQWKAFVDNGGHAG